MKALDKVVAYQAAKKAGLLKVRRWDFFAGPRRAKQVLSAQEAYDLGHKDGQRYGRLDGGLE